MLLAYIINMVILGTSQGLRIVDLTHEHSSSTIFWPGNPRYNFTILSRGSNGSYW